MRVTIVDEVGSTKRTEGQQGQRERTLGPYPCSEDDYLARTPVGHLTLRLRTHLSRGRFGGPSSKTRTTEHRRPEGLPRGRKEERDGTGREERDDSGRLPPKKPHSFQKSVKITGRVSPRRRWSRPRRQYNSLRQEPPHSLRLIRESDRRTHPPCPTYPPPLIRSVVTSLRDPSSTTLPPAPSTPSSPYPKGVVQSTEGRDAHTTTGLLPNPRTLPFRYPWDRGVSS